MNFVLKNNNELINIVNPQYESYEFLDKKGLWMDRGLGETKTQRTLAGTAMGDLLFNTNTTSTHHNNNHNFWQHFRLYFYGLLGGPLGVYLGYIWASSGGALGELPG